MRRRVYCGLCRLSEESERTGQYVSEVSRLKQEVTSRDRAVIELNNELERLRQQITQLNDSYQLALHQRQLAQQAAYVRLHDLTMSTRYIGLTRSVTGLQLSECYDTIRYDTIGEFGLPGL